MYNRADIDASRVVWARAIDSGREREPIDCFSGRIVWHLEVDGRGPVLELHPLAEREGGGSPSTRIPEDG